MPKVLSLPRDSYAEMVRVMKLPFRGIETTAVVGPFFWCCLDQDDEDPHLRASISHSSHFFFTILFRSFCLLKETVKKRENTISSLREEEQRGTMLTMTQPPPLTPQQKSSTANQTSAKKGKPAAGKCSSLTRSALASRLASSRGHPPQILPPRCSMSARVQPKSATRCFSPSSSSRMTSLRRMTRSSATHGIGCAGWKTQ